MIRRPPSPYSVLRSPFSVLRSPFPPSRRVAFSIRLGVAHFARGNRSFPLCQCRGRKAGGGTVGCLNPVLSLQYRPESRGCTVHVHVPIYLVLRRTAQDCVPCRKAEPLWSIPSASPSSASTRHRSYIDAAPAHTAFSHCAILHCATVHFCIFAFLHCALCIAHFCIFAFLHF